MGQDFNEPRRHDHAPRPRRHEAEHESSRGSVHEGKPRCARGIITSCGLEEWRYLHEASRGLDGHPTDGLLLRHA